ncbi:MAG TPA: hypothetical protein VFM09_07745 [Marmoricola sp.]|nr:hypothetical protein [Marmoricola sp.]
MATVTTAPRKGGSPARARAWTFVALAPLGLVLGVVVWWRVLAVTGAVTFPADRFGAAVDLGGLVLALFVGGLVAMAAPSGAVLCARRAEQEGDSRAHVAVTTSWVLFGVSAGIFGALPLLVWGPVVYVRWRRVGRHRGTSP